MGNDVANKPTPVMSSSDFFVEEKPVTESAPLPLNDLVFLPNWKNKPKEQPAVLTLNGVPILSHQNTAAVIAAPGYGKSSICEASAASYVNPYADCLGLQANKECEGVIVIDFERTNIDVWNSFYRASKRAGAYYGQEINNVVFAGMRSIPRLQERLEAIESLLMNNPCSFLILDGAGDMVTDTNDLPQAIECRIFLRELTVKYNLSILTTLHPNPGSFKPRGHIGSEILREAECVLVVKNIEGDCKLLTTDFDHGKNRNSSRASAAYKWNEEKKMFLSVDIDEVRASKQDARDEVKMEWTKNQAKKVLPPPTSLKNNDLIAAIMKTVMKSESTAKRLVRDMVGWGFIEKGEDLYYRLIV